MKGFERKVLAWMSSLSLDQGLKFATTVKMKLFTIAAGTPLIVVLNVSKFTGTKSTSVPAGESGNVITDTTLICSLLI
ncbi:hypothetical protein TNCV_820881 [Trichonephila clavipes]|nr:hypothetical protein TNCV_820881 [Trichonephila clavipes]